MKAGYVYIVASGKNGTIYIGSTSDLVKRVFEHREGWLMVSPRSMAAGCWYGSKCMRSCRKRGDARRR